MELFDTFYSTLQNIQVVLKSRLVFHFWWVGCAVNICAAGGSLALTLFQIVCNGVQCEAVQCGAM